MRERSNRLLFNSLRSSRDYLIIAQSVLTLSANENLIIKKFEDVHELSHLS